MVFIFYKIIPPKANLNLKISVFACRLQSLPFFPALLYSIRDESFPLHFDSIDNSFVIFPQTPASATLE